MQTVIIKYLTEKLAVLRYLEKVYGLATIVRRGDITFPAVYEKDEPISVPWDSYRALTYLIPGVVSRTTTEHPYLACNDQVEETYPFTLILYSNSKENRNCLSISQNIAWGITSYLNGKQILFERGVGLENAIINISSIDTNKDAVWLAQHSLPSKLKDNDILIAINFNVVISGVMSCFIQQPCNFVAYTYPASYTTFCSKVDECFASKTQELTVTILQGQNTFPHTLGVQPDLISFWQGNNLWEGQFIVSSDANNVYVTSSDNLGVFQVKLLKF